MTLSELTSTQPRLIRKGRMLYLAWPDFWVSVDHGKLGQWVGCWSRPDVEALVASIDLSDGHATMR